jgi:hypothetical protein
MKKPQNLMYHARILPIKESPTTCHLPPSEPDPSQPPSRQEDPPPEEPERGFAFCLRRTRRQRKLSEQY